jgi:glycosyltransferase involved in cell wall biosynthesis
MWNKIASLFNSKHIDVTVNLDFFDPIKKTILIIDDNLPQHDKSSGSKRLFELIKIFKSSALNVIFMPNDGLKTEPYGQQLKQLKVDVLLYSPNRKAMLKNLKSLLKEIDYAWISRPILNKEFQKIIKKSAKAKIIFDTVDLHYIRIERQAENENNKKLRIKALKFKKLELDLAKKADATITITAIEQKLLENENINNVFTIPNIHELNPSPKEISFEQRNGLVFIGGYMHEPNVDAVKWLITEIMPTVWSKLPDVKVHLLGSYPTSDVLNLTNKLVFVPGYVEDVSNYFYTAKIFVAPLRYGAGMKGKIGQSLEFGLPVVTTNIGAEGMNLIDGENVSIADETQDFANKIINLYENPQLWHKMKANAEKSLANYAPIRVKEQLVKLLNSLDHQ